MGYCDCCAAFSDFEEGFKKTVSRGPDDSRIIDTGKGLLGFHRLAIMGLTPDGMQPFELDGSYVVCNGEIAKFQAIEDVTEAANDIRDVILGKMDALRAVCDEAETITAKEFWPFPTYSDLLFSVK